MNKPSSVSYLPLRGAIAGAITGAVEMSVNFPTDYVKTQLQLDEYSVNRRYNGVADVVRKTVKEHGIRGLYRGLNVAIWNPKVAVRFAAFEQLTKLLQDSNGKLSYGGLLFCGMGAGVFEGAFAVTPIESVKVKFIHDQNSNSPRYKGLFHGIRLIVKEKGIGGLYQGVVPTIIKSATNQGSRFFVVGVLKDWYKKLHANEPAGKSMIALFGAVAGAVSVLVTSPADVVKSRMQGLNSYKYSGTLNCAQQIWIKEGPSAFYKGAIPRLIRVPIEVAIVFSVYEIVMDLLAEVW